MATLFDYIEWRGDLSFEDSPLNEVDCLMLAWLSYADFDGYVSGDFSKDPIRLYEASERYHSDHDGIDERAISLSFSEAAAVVFKKCSNSRRFGNLGIHGFRNEINYKDESQFSAVTLKLSPTCSVIVFRGTDDTIVGWKEDFNMSFMEEVPAQKKALEYVEEVASKSRGDLVICGHSKGGNLAIYSACFASKKVRKRIARIYNYDGPGFGKNTDMGENFEDTLRKTFTYVPSESIVGMLLNHDNDYTIVRSSAKGLGQHDAGTWQIKGTKIETVDSLEKGSVVLNTAIRQWIDSLSDDERRDFCKTLFTIVSANEAKTLSELSADKIKTTLGMLKEYRNLGKESKEMMLRILGSFLKENMEARKHRKDTRFREDC